MRRTYSLEESLENDLIQEGRMRVFEKLHLYEGRARFTTWAWTVSWRAMLDHAEWLVRGRKNEVFGLDETHVASDFAATSDLRLTLFSAMRAVPNSDLVLYSAFGYQDKEIAAGNIRMRRSRARDRLQVLLREDLALSA